VDGLTSKINYDFIRELKRRGFLPADIKVRYKQKDSNPRLVSRTLNYKTYDSLISSLSFVNEANYLCYSGELGILENFKITVTSKNFAVSFTCFNITGSIVIRESVSFDNKRGDFYATEIERLRKTLLDLIDKYKQNINTAVDVRINSYLDPCYVDAGYVSPNSN
jgi:hypothetical protein